MDKNVLIKKYCEALNERRAAIFAGAGLSAPAGFVIVEGRGRGAELQNRASHQSGGVGTVLCE